MVTQSINLSALLALIMAMDNHPSEAINYGDLCIVIQVYSH